MNSSSQTVSGVQLLLNGTFMETPVIDTDGKTLNYAEVIYEAGRTNNVNPYVLATMIITEQGRNGSEMVSGTSSIRYGYFNFFNINANGTTASAVLQNGLNYAYSKGWNTRYKAIIEGASFYASSYVNRGQTTLYLKRFNVQGDSAFSNQYMTSVYGPYVEGGNLASVYSGDIRNAALSFYIPVYPGMPDTACPKPTGDGSPDNRLSSLSINGYTLTPSFSNNQYTYDVVVPSNVNTVTISATVQDARASVKGTGNITLSGTLTTCNIQVTAENGTVREFIINIGKEGSNTIFTDNYKVYNSYIRGIPLGTTAEEFESSLVSSGSVSVVNNGIDKTGTLCTGDKAIVYDTDGSTYGVYDIIIMGDVMPDGNINISDLMAVKNSLINKNTLNENQKTAADVNNSSSVDIGDVVQIKNHIIGKNIITQ